MSTEFDLFSCFDEFYNNSSQENHKDKNTDLSGEKPDQFETADKKVEKVDLQSGRSIGKTFESQPNPPKEKVNSCEDCCYEGIDPDETDALKPDADEDDTAADRAELAGKVVQVGESNNPEDMKSDKKDEKKPVFNHTTFICYAGLSLSITKLFQGDYEKLSVDDVRKRMEKDYPELSKQRTKMDYDEKKNIIVPIVTGGKKGAFFVQGMKGFFSSPQELVRHIEPINFLAARDGFYEVRENPIGVFVARTEEEELLCYESFHLLKDSLHKVATLSECRSGLKLRLPKIPLDLFSQLLSLFIDYSDQDVEVMGVIYFDRKSKRHVLYVPKQTVSKVSVNALYPSIPAHYIKMAEIHSHNTMRAFFSTVDNEDEKETILYGVVGRMGMSGGDITFDMETRAGLAGKFIPLPPSTWIEGNLGMKGNRISYTAYPDTWKSNVHISRRGQRGNA